MANPGDERAAGNIPPGPWIADDANSEGEPNEVWHIYAAYDTKDEVKVAEAYNKPNADMIASVPEMREALQEIAKGKGRFSRDPLTHASNTIEDMKALAVGALAGVQPQAPADYKGPSPEDLRLVAHILRPGHHRLALVIDDETTDEEKGALMRLYMAFGQDAETP